MARGVSLGQMVTDLRAEVGHSPDAALGKNKLAQLQRILRRTQSWLYDDFDWPFLNLQEDIQLNPGQRFYDFPSGISIENVKSYAVRWGGQYLPMVNGIGALQYSSMESEQTGASGSFTITAGAAAAATGGFTINAGTLGGSNVISQITINATTTLLSASVPWGTSHTATAAAVVVAINLGTGTHGYSASNIGAAVTLTADPDAGTGTNGYTVSVTVGGDVTVTSVSNFSGGASNRITKIEVDGVDILDGSPIGWRTSNTATATAVAAAINATNTVPNYTATARANEVTITADPQSDDAGNDREIEVTVAGSVTVGTPVDLSGGILSVRSDPATNIDLRQSDGAVQIEVWPVPASRDQVLRIFHKLPLNPFIANADTCTLDDTLIVLFAAHEILSAEKNDRAAKVEKLALNLYNKLRGRAGGARRRLSMVPGATDSGRQHGIRVAYVR
jgi:hypothetical protein